MLDLSTRSLSLVLTLACVALDGEHNSLGSSLNVYSVIAQCAPLEIFVIMKVPEYVKVL